MHTCRCIAACLLHASGCDRSVEPMLVTGPCAPETTRPPSRCASTSLSFPELSTRDGASALACGFDALALTHVIARTALVHRTRGFAFKADPLHDDGGFVHAQLCSPLRDAIHALDADVKSDIRAAAERLRHSALISAHAPHPRTGPHLARSCCRGSSRHPSCAAPRASPQRASCSTRP